MERLRFAKATYDGFHAQLPDEGHKRGKAKSRMSDEGTRRRQPEGRCMACFVPATTFYSASRRRN